MGVASPAAVKEAMEKRKQLAYAISVLEEMGDHPDAVEVLQERREQFAQFVRDNCI